MTLGAFLRTHLSLVLSSFRHLLSCDGVDEWFPAVSVSSLWPCTEHMPYTGPALRRPSCADGGKTEAPSLGPAGVLSADFCRLWRCNGHLQFVRTVLSGISYACPELEPFKGGLFKFGGLSADSQPNWLLQSSTWFTNENTARRRLPGGTRPRYRRTGISPPEQGAAPQPDQNARPPP